MAAVSLAGKVAVVTGTSDGVGLALARQLVEAGCSVAGIGLEAASPFSHANYTYLQGDITEASTRTRFIGDTLKRFGRIDILINNAAVGIYASSYDTSEAEVKRLYDVNVIAGLELIKLALPELKQTHGSIVNIGSICGTVTVPWATIYCSTKFAVHGITQGLRRELKDDGVHVLLVMPGVIRTKFRQHVIRGKAPGKVEHMSLTISPENVARDIVRAVAKRKSNLYTPLHLAFPFMKMQEYTPWLMDWYLRSKL